MKFKNFVCVSLLFITLTTYSQDYYSSLTISPELKKNANAVLRVDDTKIEVVALDKLYQKYKRVVTILNKNGLRHTGAYLYYDAGISVKKLEAKIYDKIGNVIKKVKKSDFNDVSAINDFSLYEESRVKYLEYTPTDYPFTIEFSYEISTHNTSNIPGWRPLEGYNISTENSNYELICGSISKVNLLERNFENFNIKDFSDSDFTKYKANNIQAIKPEDLSPKFSEIGPLLMITLIKFSYEGVLGYVSSWEDFGIWMHSNLLKGRDQLSESTKNKIKAKVKGITNPLEKAKIVYKYVQDNTRYISVQVGIGGIQPIEAVEVDNTKYGDCKGLSNYTKALLDVVGVNAFYTHVQAGNNKTDFETNFPSLAQGNHAILYFSHEGKDYWLDSTSQTIPFGHIANFTDDRDVLVITPEGGRIVHTRAYLSKENYLKSKATVIFDGNGAFEAEYRSAAGGTRYDRKLQVLESDTKDKKDYYKNYWSNINDISLEKIELKNNREDVEIFELVAMSAPKYGVVAGEKLLISTNIFKKSTYLPPRYSERKLPFVIQRGYYNEDVYEISLPEGYALGPIPENMEIETKFGTYKSSIEKLNDSKIIYKRTLEITKGDYNKDDYNAYRSFRRKIVKADKSSIVLNKLN